jgi:hypothetical protein
MASGKTIDPAPSTMAMDAIPLKSQAEQPSNVSSAANMGTAQEPPPPFVDLLDRILPRPKMIVKKMCKHGTVRRSRMAYPENVVQMNTAVATLERMEMAATPAVTTFPHVSDAIKR